LILSGVRVKDKERNKKEREEGRGKREERSVRFDLIYRNKSQKIE
jgi:hypothetical protein